MCFCLDISSYFCPEIKVLTAHTAEEKMTNQKRILFIFTLMLTFFQLPASSNDDTYGGWEFLEVSHDFTPKVWSSFYFEHDNLRYRTLDVFYTRLTTGYKFTKWLKNDVAWDWFKERKTHYHRFLYDLTGTLKEGNLTASIRERYVLTHHPSNHTQSSVLRSRLKTQYAIPDSRLKPYLAVEVFTWDKWEKTRYYVGTTVKCNDWLEFECYYLYYVYAKKPAIHLLGLGFNLDI